MSMCTQPLGRARPSPRTVRIGKIVFGSAVALGLIADFNDVAPGSEQAQVHIAGTRPFADTSPFNTPVNPDPLIDANSAAMVAQAARTGMVHANLYEYGIPIYTATASTPKHAVDCTGPATWGVCPFESRAMPIPAGAVPNRGSDGVMAVIDTATGTVGEYWQVNSPARSSTSTTWGAVNLVSGSGWGGSSTGAGASRIGGVVRIAEIEAGVIDHALVMQSDNVCKDVFRPPALKTDGESTRRDCLPAGARLQLDPGLDVSTIDGITPGEVTVARALQIHGAYVIDRADTSLSISFELAPDATSSSPGSVYQEAGFAWDYYGMPNIPWDKLRVLDAWED